MALLTLALLPVQAYGCWVDVPLSKVIKESPLVIRGKIVAIEHAAPADHALDTATIQVDEVLKDQTGKKLKAGSQIPLMMPAENNRVRSSIDLRYQNGAEGFWILEFRDGGYHATYPKDFQALEKRPEVKDALAESVK